MLKTASALPLRRDPAGRGPRRDKREEGRARMPHARQCVAARREKGQTKV